ncbi:GumC family protein [Rhizobium sp. 32-5/1]|uniref:GumC family protein n=1 Tax=Rhizobium sp. 32-5/1 TaxID=3019602 RepID=UPI00240DF4E5|nr:GumC family protein [Rhizobium sp. 32-5/1]WEZ84380.1 GumC family protein [Rhizobium sp. 32-5/1]
MTRWLNGDPAADDSRQRAFVEPAAEEPRAQPRVQAEEHIQANEPPHGGGSDRERPLIDMGIIVGSVWQLRHIILATTVLGAVGGVMLALATPSIYIAESKLYVDPREIRLTDSDLSKASLATEAILALVDSQLEVLRSRTVLEKVAADLGLDRDPEFGSIAGDSGNMATGIGVISDLMTGDKTQPLPAASTGVGARTLENLSDAVTVSRDPKTFIVTIEVETKDPAKSALIANRIVQTFLNEETAAQSGFFQRTTAALDSRLADLRTELDKAENAVEKYKADNDIVGASGELISDKQLLALNDQVGIVRSRIADAQAKADVATKIQLNDVLSGAYPEELGSATLAELRKQYSSARAQLGALDASLGPRHPQRLAAAQSLEVARNEIGNELRRVAATTKTELERAKRTEQDLVRQLAVQKSRQVNSSQDFVQLRELERKAAATRSIYESFLKRASETGQEEKLTSKNIRVISSAEPPLQPEGPSRKLIAIGGMMAGLMGGLGLGILLGIYRSLRNTINLSRQSSDGMPDQDPPGYDDDHNRRRRIFDDEAEAPVWRQPVTRSTMPSPHHEQAALAARGAAQHAFHQEPPRDAGVSQVRDDLRALRSRVEHYARQRTGTGR